MVESEPDPPRRHGVFISYARDDDEAFAKRLWRDLEANGIAVWWDRESMESRGLSFLREIRDAITSAERLLLIVGPMAGRSAYVECEWRHALREGVVVTPLLRGGDRADVPLALRSLHCEDVGPHVAEFEALAKVRRIVSTPVPVLGRLVGVPRLPSPYVDRPERLDRLRSRVLIDSLEPVDLEADHRITALTGMGGIGKSVLAAALVHAPDVRRSFTDGIFWVTLRRDPDVLRGMRRVGLALGADDVSRYDNVPDARLLLSKTLAGRNCLIVLDDVVEPSLVEALHTAASKRVHLLLTSRTRTLFASAGSFEVPVDELDETAARELLASWVQIPVDGLPAEAAEIIEECGRLPLAISMIGATIRGRADGWTYALERLRRADLSKIGRKLPDYEHESLDRAMLVSFEDLDPLYRQRYLDFVAIPEDVAAPSRMLRAWWSQEGMDDLDASDVLQHLVDRSLLRMDAHDACTVHDVQRDFLAMRADERGLHIRWLAAFAARSPGGWASSDDDGYLFDHLGHHLVGAERAPEWTELLTSFEWLARKSSVRGFSAALLDLAEQSQDGRVRLLSQICRRVAHVLTHDPSQLAAQLLARIDPEAHGGTFGRLLDGARAWRQSPWLRPLTVSMADDGEPTIVVFHGHQADGHAGTPRSLALSVDGSLIASGGGSSNDPTIKIWSVGAARLLRTYRGAVEAGGCTRLAFTGRDGRIVGATRRELRLYVLDHDEPVARCELGGATVGPICGGNARVVFAGLDDGRVLAWDGASEPITLRPASGDGVLAIARAAGSRRIAIITTAAVECRDADDGSLIGRLDEPGGHAGSGWNAPPVAIVPDGSRVLFGSDLRTWTIGEPASTPASQVVRVDRVIAVAGNGDVAFVQSGGKEITAMELGSGRKTGRISNSREFSCVVPSLDGQLVATGDFEHDVKLWDVTCAGAEPPAWQRRGRASLVAFPDDPTSVVVVTPSGAEVWDRTNGKLRGDLAQSPASASLRYGGPIHDGQKARQVRSRLIEALGRDGSTDLLQQEVPAGVLAIAAAASRAVSATFLNAKIGDRQESGCGGDGDGHPLHLWDLNDPRNPILLHGHTEPVDCLAITPDGKYALSGSRGRVLRFWDLDGRKHLHRLAGHAGEVFCCALSESGRLAVSGSEDMTLRLWDLRKGALLFTFATSSAVTACDIARDGSAVIAAETSGRVHLFRVENLPAPAP